MAGGLEAGSHCTHSLGGPKLAVTVAGPFMNNKQVVPVHVPLQYSSWYPGLACATTAIGLPAS